MRENEMLGEVVAHLADMGVRAEILGPPSGAAVGKTAEVTLSRAASRQVYTLIWAETVTLLDLGGTGRDLPRLVATWFVTQRSADALRRLGVQYVDAAGNAWVEFGDVLIDIRGRRALREREYEPSATPSNLFSTARSQVAFALLTWPWLWKAPQRTLAAMAGVSLGQANNALKLLRRAGFDPNTGGRRSDLLDLWAAAFPTGLAQKLTLGTYHGSVESLEKVRGEDGLLARQASVSGEVAARDLLHPASLTIYVEHLDPLLPVRFRWRSDGPPNVIVRRRFWTAPDATDNDHGGPDDEAGLAPWPLVYADLLASPDPRVQSAAKEWKALHARPVEDPRGDAPTDTARR